MIGAWKLVVEQIRMVRYVVLARMEDQRLAFPPPVVNHFTEENHVVAASEFSNHSANEVSGGAFQ
jgi:hypothetical protein